MSLLGVTRRHIAFVCGLVVALTACGEDDPLGTPQSPAQTGGEGGEGGSGGVGDSGGAGGEPPGACGDGVLDPGEACDGDELEGVTCIDLGHEWGTPTCLDDCSAASDETCFSTESCIDGIDNDGDGSADCEDSECEASCADACLSPIPLEEPGVIDGTLDGHGSILASSCTSGLGPDGPEVAFTVVAATTGVLEIELASDDNLVVSARSGCEDPASELACANDKGLAQTERLSIPVTQGETIVVVVEGYGAGDAGAFTLAVESHAVVCGDGTKDSAEGCDDGNNDSGDGCSAACVLELTEIEPNDDPLDKNPMTDPFVGEISPAGDVDFIEVVIPGGPASLVVEAFDSDGSCAGLTADSYIEIWSADGTELLAADDDGGEGYCAKAEIGGLATGTYLVRVSASPFDPDVQFPYYLMTSIEVDVCGDGVDTVAEQCDDGNLTGGDGCDASCAFELTESEPNGKHNQADTFVSPWRGFIGPGDEDWVKLAVTTGQILSVQVTDLGMGTCGAGLLDSYVQIYGPNGTSLLYADDDSGVGYCSYLETAPLTSGTYFVRVAGSPFDPEMSFFYGLIVQTF